MSDRGYSAPAVIRLGGHPRVRAHLRVTRYPAWLYAGRIAVRAVCWVGGAWGTLAVTFDPFVASFPFVIGMGYTWRALKGRYKVHDFRGSCPRCGEPLAMKPGAKINLPCSMVCYHCHHEPELLLEEGSTAVARSTAPRPDLAAG